MKNKEYTSLVNEGKFPSELRVPLDKPFEDARGKIQNLVLDPITSVAIITSKAGTVRSNHYHKTDWHYLYVISGSMKYYERDVDSDNQIEPIVVKAGEMVFTGPMKVHKTEFLEDTVMMSFAKNVRDHEHHEEDVVRVEF
jgi:dTDP-4-dehydrorhamnose 3,5-epimerase-like enzyme